MKTIKKGKTLKVGQHEVKVKELLGSGGFADVFLVKDVNSMQNYALKSVSGPDAASVKLIYKEFALLKLKSPYIVSYIDSAYETVKGTGFMGLLLMEYCSHGRVVDLMNEYVKKGKKFSSPLVIKIFTSVTHAIHYLHSFTPPIAHRDLKVENVLINLKEGFNEIGERGEGADFKLCDFGSITTQELKSNSPQNERRTAEDEIEKFTTFESRAPEQINVMSSGVSVNHLVDIWALGCLLYKISFFQDPFTEKLQIINGNFQIPSDSNRGEKIHKSIKYLLQVDPLQRPTSSDVLNMIETNSDPFKSLSPGNSFDFGQKKLSRPSSQNSLNSMKSQSSQHSTSSQTLSQTSSQPLQSQSSESSEIIQEEQKVSHQKSPSESSLPEQNTFQKTQKFPLKFTLLGSVETFCGSKFLSNTSISNSIAFQSPKHICVTFPTEVVVLEEAEEFSTYSPIIQKKVQAHRALYHLTKDVISLNISNIAQIFEVEQKIKIDSFNFPREITFWKWIHENTIAVISNNTAFHWHIFSENEPTHQQPIQIFPLIDPLTSLELINYEIDDYQNPLWMLVQGKNKQNSGVIQLHSIAKNANQIIETPLATFVRIQNSELFLLVFVSKTYDSINLVQLIRPNTPSYINKKVRLDFSPNDPPIALHVIDDISVIFLVTKNLTFCAVDLLSGETIFQVVGQISLPKQLQDVPNFENFGNEMLICHSIIDEGFLFILIDQYYRVFTLELDQDFDEIVKPLPTNDPLRLLCARFTDFFGFEKTERPPLPIEVPPKKESPFNSTEWTKEIFEEEFQKAIDDHDFKRAGLLASKDRFGVVRNMESISKIVEIDQNQFKCLPILQFFEALTLESKLNAEESTTYFSALLKIHSDSNFDLSLASHAINYFRIALDAGKLTPSLTLADLLSTQENFVDYSILAYRSLGEFDKLLQTLQEHKKFQQLLLYLSKFIENNTSFSTSFSLSIFEDILNENGQLAIEYATLYNRRSPLSILELNSIYDFLQRKGLIQALTTFFLSTLEDSPQYSDLQTKILELNLNFNPQAAIIILEQGRFSSFDKPYILNLCQVLGYYKQSINISLSLSDYEAVAKNLVTYSFSLGAEYFIEVCYKLLDRGRKDIIRNILTLLLETKRTFDTELFFHIASQFSSSFDHHSIISMIDDYEQDVVYKYLLQLGPSFEISKAHYSKMMKIGLKLSMVLPLYYYFQPLLQSSKNLEDFVDISLLKDVLIIICLGTSEPLTVDEKEPIIQNLFQLSVQYNFQEELVVRLLNHDQLLYRYLLFLPSPEISLRTFLMIGRQDLVEKFLLLFKNSSHMTAFQSIILQEKEKLLPIQNLNLEGKSLIDYYLLNDQLLDLSYFLSKKQDLQLWAYVLQKKKDFLTFIENSSIFLLTISAQEFSILLKFLVSNEREYLEDVINLLYKVLIGIVCHPFREHGSLQVLFLSTVLKSSQPEKIKEFLPHLKNFDSKEICKLAIQLSRFEEAILISQYSQDYRTCIEILVNHVGDMKRAFDFAHVIDTPDVWVFVGKAQWRKYNSQN